MRSSYIAGLFKAPPGGWGLRRQVHTTSGMRQEVLSVDDGPKDKIPSGWKGVHRFYDNVGVRGLNDDGAPVENDQVATQWQVLIQGRVLRTLQLNDLVLPSEGLALAIAAEFGRQGEQINPTGTPLYNLSCFAIDTFMKEEVDSLQKRPVVRAELHNYLKHQAARVLQKLSHGPEAEAALVAASADKVHREGLDAPLEDVSATVGEIPFLRDPILEGALTTREDNYTRKLREMLKDYLETDTACFRVSATGAASDVMLRRKQDHAYEPLIEWFRDTFGIQLGVAEGIMDTEHPPEAFAVVEDFVDRADPFLRAALHQLVGTLKSTLLTMAVVYRHVSLDQAFSASRVEEEFQIEENGFIEDGHDTARVETRLRIASASAFLWLLPESDPGNAMSAFHIAARIPGERAAAEALASVGSGSKRRRRARSRPRGTDTTDEATVGAKSEGDKDAWKEAVLAGMIARTRLQRAYDVVRQEVEHKETLAMRQRILGTEEGGGQGEEQESNYAEANEPTKAELVEEAWRESERER